MADSTMEITQWQTCGSQVVDDKSSMGTTQWQTCGSQVVDDESLIAVSTMEVV
jgi:hypothetical protein